MGIAQKLYEAGHITYMRTDSTVLSAVAQAHIITIIEKKYGKDYTEARVYKTKSKSAQEAHEAIRPTDAALSHAGSTEEQKKLYELIWQRSVASQMKSARLLKTKIIAQIGAGTAVPDFFVNGSRTLYDGWLKADPRAKGEDVELPQVTIGDPLTLLDLCNEKKETQPLPRYSEAGLVKELEKRGIGRPSTYASIIRTIQDRGYAEKEGRSLKPTDTGEVVSSFLEKHFAKYISDTFTAEMEDKLDDIALGKRDYEKTLRDFYTPFARDVASKKDTEKLTTLGEAPTEFPCPLCAAPMVVKLGRSGKFLSCSRFPECMGIRATDGKELEGPKETGELCPECKTGKLIERDGKFGRFVACGNYPKCKYIKKDASLKQNTGTGITCPVCKKGEMCERRGRFGIFYSCSNYPICKYAIKAKPTGNLCPTCDALMMEGTKTIPERCSKKECANHNPHKEKSK
jgi:DNA topoisomerase-1